LNTVKTSHNSKSKSANEILSKSSFRIQTIPNSTRYFFLKVIYLVFLWLLKQSKFSIFQIILCLTFDLRNEAGHCTDLIFLSMSYWSIVTFSKKMVNGKGWKLFQNINNCFHRLRNCIINVSWHAFRNKNVSRIS
jgi:hypothetical protein